MLIIIWANASLLLPSVPARWVVGGCTLALLPTNWLRDFSLLAWLSAVGLGAVVLILCAVVYDVGAAALDGSAASGALGALGAPRELADASGMPMAASIMLAGLTGHVGLPPMYAEMKTPSAFRRTLYAAFGAMCAMYTTVGVGGYLLYGDRAHVLITEDMAGAEGGGAEGGGAESWSRQLVLTLVLSCITFKLACGVPAVVLIQADIFFELRREAGGAELSECAADGVRLALWALGVLAALAIRPYLEYVTALIGVNSMLISVLLPLVFYLQLHGAAMSTLARAAYALVLLFSVVLTAAITYADLDEFLQKIGAY